MANTEENKLKNNIYIVFAAGILLGAVLGHLYTKVQMLEKGAGGGSGGTVNEAAAPEPAKKIEVAKPDPKKDHWRGSEDAKVVVVEYSDFECPFCSSFFETMKKVEETYGDEVAVVYRHFPLSFHPKAEPAARASECVADLAGNDAFWLFHDGIFGAMPDVEVDEFADIAANAGANKAAFQKCLDDEKFADVVKESLDTASAAGVAATPTSVIFNMKTGDTEVIEGALPYESVKQAIDGML